MSQPKYSIGQTFTCGGKVKRVCTIIDIYKTFNSAGDLVKIAYVAEHQFLGQAIRDHDVCEVTIARGQ
jgi:hypothetical protein